MTPPPPAQFSSRASRHRPPSPPIPTAGTGSAASCPLPPSSAGRRELVASSLLFMKLNFDEQKGFLGSQLFGAATAAQPAPCLALQGTASLFPGRGWGRGGDAFFSFPSSLGSRGVGCTTEWHHTALSQAAPGPFSPNPGVIFPLAPQHWELGAPQPCQDMASRDLGSILDLEISSCTSDVALLVVATSGRMLSLLPPLLRFGTMLHALTSNVLASQNTPNPTGGDALHHAQGAASCQGTSEKPPKRQEEAQGGGGGHQTHRSASPRDMGMAHMIPNHISLPGSRMGQQKQQQHHHLHRSNQPNPPTHRNPEWHQSIPISGGCCPVVPTASPPLGSLQGPGLPPKALGPW